MSKRETYQMPHVALGDIVLWRHDKSCAPVVAIVTSVAGESVELAILFPGFYNFQAKAGVRHIDHPDQDYPIITETGVWEHRPLALGPVADDLPPIYKAKKAA